MTKDDAALVIAVAVGVQSTFSATMPPLADVARSTDPLHATTATVAAARAGVLVALAAWLGKSRPALVAGGLLVAADWWLYRRAAMMRPAGA